MRTRFLEQMAMYSSYHRHRWNRRLHLLGVPSITLGLLLLLAMVPLGRIGPVPLSLATAFAAAVMAYWVWLDPRVGTVTVLAYLPLVVVATWLAGLDPTGRWSLFGASFFGGWMVQLVGHRIEGRKPALLDNVGQTLIAPLFLTAELGYRMRVFSGLRHAIEQRWTRYLQPRS